MSDVHPGEVVVYRPSRGLQTVLSVTFFLILSVGYLYVWRKGALDWAPAARAIRRGSRKAA